MYMRGVLLNKFIYAYLSIPIHNIKDKEYFTILSLSNITCQIKFLVLRILWLLEYIKVEDYTVK